MLEEKKSSAVKVKLLERVETENYGEDVYPTIPINVNLNENKVSRLLKAFKIVHPKGMSELTVIRTEAFEKEKKLYLLDGQHRRAAALRLAFEIGMPVTLDFRIVEIDGEDTLKNIHEVSQVLNDSAVAWTPKDYTAVLSKLNLPNSIDYQILAELSEKHNIGQATMLQILSLNTCSMSEFKQKQFRIVDRKKSDAILNVLQEIGFNDPKIDKYNGFPHNYIKRSLIKQFLIMGTKEIEESISKFKQWLNEGNEFSYDETIFKNQLDAILRVESEV